MRKADRDLTIAPMSQAKSPPGYYPDAAGTGFQWWNGSSWTGQSWQPPPEEELFNVTLLESGLGPKLRLRGTLMQLLGLSKDDAKALIDASPCVVAVRVPKSSAEKLIQEIVDMGGNLAEWRSTGMTAGTFLAGVRPQQALAPVAAPSPVAAPTPPTFPAPPAAPPEPPLDPRFGQVEVQFMALLGQLRAGALTPDQMNEALYALAFERGGRHWILRSNSLQWYASAGGDWEPTTPPA